MQTWERSSLVRERVETQLVCKYAPTAWRNITITFFGISSDPPLCFDVACTVTLSSGFLLFCSLHRAHTSLLTQYSRGSTRSDSPNLETHRPPILIGLTRSRGMQATHAQTHRSHHISLPSTLGPNTPSAALRYGIVKKLRPDLRVILRIAPTIRTLDTCRRNMSSPFYVSHYFGLGWRYAASVPDLSCLGKRYWRRRIPMLRQREGARSECPGRTEMWSFTHDKAMTACN